MKSAHGQASTEVLLLIGLMLALLVPLIIYAYGRAGVAQDSFATQKAEFAAQRLAGLADSVGYLGGNASIVDQVDVPSGVKSVELKGNGHDIVFRMNSPAGEKDIVKSSAFNITSKNIGMLSSGGTYFVRVRALSSFGGGPQIEMTVQ